MFLDESAVAPLKTGARVIGTKYLFLRTDQYTQAAISGGRGSRKSHEVAGFLADEAYTSKKRVVCAREFQKSTTESSLELVFDKCNSLYPGFFRKTLGTIVGLNGSRFTFIGLKVNPESVKSTENVDYVWVEEAQTITRRSFELLRDTFLRKHGSRLIFTWNPRFKKDPIDAYYRGKVKPPGSIHIHTTFRDNPYFYRTEMPAQMEFSRENEVERYSHIWEGDYDENSQARIFTNVSIGRISVPDDVQPLYGLDFGFSKDPSALIKLYVLHKERIIYIAEEAFGTGITTKDMPAFLDTVTGVRQWQIIADSSSPRIIEDLRQASFNVAPSRKGPGSVNAGINWLRSYKIMISPDCDHMQEEAIRYYWKQDRMGNPLPMPASGWDHGWDAVRYACEDEMLGNGSGSVVDEFDDYIF